MVVARQVCDGLGHQEREMENFGPKYFRVVREEQKKNSTVVYGVPHVDKKDG